MGVWNSYCTICGGPLYSDLIEDKENNKFVSPTPQADFHWLNNLRAINAENGLSKACRVDGFGPEIKEKENPSTLYRPLSEDDLYDEDPYDDAIPSAIVHEGCLAIFDDCAPASLTNLNRKELFEKIKPHLDADSMNALFKEDKVNYANMNRFQQQFFSFEDTSECKGLISNPNEPSGSDNLSRIKDIILTQITPLLEQA